jgi:phage-related holin
MEGMLPLFAPLFTNATIDSILTAPLLLVLIDFITGVVRAAKTNQFQLRKIADFLGSSFLKYLIVLIATAIVFIVSGSATASVVASTLGMGALSIALCGSILENVATLGLPPAIEKEVDTAVQDIDRIIIPPPPIVPMEMTAEMTSVRLARIGSFWPTERMQAARNFFE